MHVKSIITVNKSVRGSFFYKKSSTLLCENSLSDISFFDIGSVYCFINFTTWAVTFNYASSHQLYRGLENNNDWIFGFVSKFCLLVLFPQSVLQCLMFLQYGCYEFCWSSKLYAKFVFEWMNVMFSNEQ